MWAHLGLVKRVCLSSKTKSFHECQGIRPSQALGRAQMGSGLREGRELLELRWVWSRVEDP